MSALKSAVLATIRRRLYPDVACVWDECTARTPVVLDLVRISTKKTALEPRLLALCLVWQDDRDVAPNELPDRK